MQINPSKSLKAIAAASVIQFARAAEAQAEALAMDPGSSGHTHPHPHVDTTDSRLHLQYPDSKYIEFARSHDLHSDIYDNYGYQYNDNYYNFYETNKQPYSPGLIG